MKIKELIFLVVFCALIIIGSILIAFIIMDTWRYANPHPEQHQITDKIEVKDKCYIQAWIEVTPEEYIGLDIGDPYPSN